MDSFAENLLKKFIKLKEEKNGELSVADLEKFLGELIDAVDKHAEDDKDKLVKKIDDINKKIQETRLEITDDPVNGAKLELDSIVESTEDATNNILDSAEKIQDIAATLENKALAEKIGTEIVRIFEACNFQDLTGQRVRKITSALIFIEKTVGSVISTKAKEAKKEESLENGPQAKSCAPSQEDIDKLFDSI